MLQTSHAAIFRSNPKPSNGSLLIRQDYTTPSSPHCQALSPTSETMLMDNKYTLLFRGPPTPNCSSQTEPWLSVFSLLNWTHLSNPQPSSWSMWSVSPANRHFTSFSQPGLLRSHGNYFCSKTWAPRPFYPSALMATSSASHWPSVYFLWRGADQCRWIGKIVHISLALEILLWLLCLPWISHLSFPFFCCSGILLANVDSCANQTIRHCDKISDRNISEEEGFILLTVFDSKI